VVFPRSRPRDLHPSGDLGVFADERDYVAKSSAGGWGWVVNEFEDGQSASSFCSTSSSRFNLCFRAFAFCSSWYLCTFSSTVGCQLRLAKSRRHGGSEERHACLLRYVEGSACSGDGDVVKTAAGDCDREANTGNGRQRAATRGERPGRRPQGAESRSPGGCQRCGCRGCDCPRRAGGG
jgi:hypothetical protein